MSDSDFITVFDVAHAGYRNWWFPAFGLLFVLFGLFRSKLNASGLLKPKPPPTRGFRLFFVGFASLWVVAAFFGTFVDYQRSRDILLQGRAAYVEGIVQNFVPMQDFGRKTESFSVNGIPFHYSNYIVSAGFNDTITHGGPMKQGLYVRIWYSGNDILKLQILRKNSANDVSMVHYPK